jgi:hypothetical protein
MQAPAPSAGSSRRANYLSIVETSSATDFAAPWALWLLLALLLAAKLFSGLEGYPPTWCDEIVYTEPAVNYVQTGHFAAPGIARQLGTKGLTGLDEHYFLNVPLGTYARVAVYEVFGTGQPGRRLADWLFLLTAASALLFALRHWVSPRAALLAGVIFLLHRIVGDAYGRPDLLALAFGLLALWLVTKPLEADADRKIIFGRAFIAGLLIGLSGFSHQFGGVFWAALTVAAQMVIQYKRIKLVDQILWLAVFGLGGLTVAVVWLPQIASAPQAWHDQFFYLVNLKKHLAKNFGKGVYYLASDTVAKNPAACLLAAVAVLAVRQRKTVRGRFILMLLAGAAVLAVWRCHSFEAYVRQYSIHFWAVICLLMAFVFDEWSAWLGKKLPSARARLLQNATIVVLLLSGSLQTGITSVESFVLPFHRTRTEINALLQKNISPNDRVLVGDSFYYDVPARQKSVWYWSEKLDLGNYDVVVAQFPTVDDIPVSDGRDRDQYNNCFSQEQAELFRRDFELVASVHGVMLPAKFSPPHYRPNVLGCYIYRNKQPRTDLKNSQETAPGP